MKYDEARTLMQSGDIIAFSHEGWGSWSDIESQIVRMATRSEFSHVGILAPPLAGRVMILEAVVPKIRIFPLSHLLPFYWVPMGRPLTDQAFEFAMSRVGEKYSKWEAILGYLSETHNNKKWQCAEYVRAIINVMDEVFCGKNTPTDIIHDALSLGHPLHLVTK